MSLTGFCNPGNPKDSHTRCPGSYSRGPAFPDMLMCTCECHTNSSPASEDTPSPTGGDAGEGPHLDTPTGYIVTNAAPETEEWFAGRRGGITGTDLPKILGDSKFGNALSVWLDKRGELKDEAGEEALWGQILEDPVAQEWASRHASTVVPVGVLAHVDAPWMRASLDRVVIDCPDEADTHRACGLEIKTRSAFVADQWRDGMPDSVLAQVAWGRLVSGFDHMHVAALIGGQRLVTFRYDRDEVLEQFLIDQARPVWAAVEEGTPPEVDPDSEGVLLALLDKLYGSRTGDREIDPDEAEKWLAQYADGGDLERQGAKLKTEAKTALVALIDDGAAGCVEGDRLFTYKPDAAKDTVTADSLRAFKAENPEHYADLVSAGLITTTNPRPTFRVSRKKKETDPS